MAPVQSAGGLPACSPLDASSSLLPLSDPGFSILYDEGPCLAVAKPTGLLTQAPPGIDSLERRVKEFLKGARPLERVYLGVPHRLDRPVSGVIVLAKHARAARRLAEQFEGRLVRKVYWACVEGAIDPPQGTWEDFVRKVPDVAQAEVVPEGHPDGRPARLHYRVQAIAPWGTWLEIELDTGRMHQVRLQAASRGHPVLGDALYGSQVPFGAQHEDWRLRAIALHARSLSFRHPTTDAPVKLEAPLPQPWADLGLAEFAG